MTSASVQMEEREEEAAAAPAAAEEEAAAARGDPQRSAASSRPYIPATAAIHATEQFRTANSHAFVAACAIDQQPLPIASARTIGIRRGDSSGRLKPG